MGGGVALVNYKKEKETIGAEKCNFQIPIFINFFDNFFSIFSKIYIAFYGYGFRNGMFKMGGLERWRVDIIIK